MKLPFQKEARSFSHSENLPKTIKMLPVAFWSAEFHLNTPKPLLCRKALLVRNQQLALVSFFSSFKLFFFLKLQSLKTALARNSLLSKIKS